MWFGKSKLEKAFAEVAAGKTSCLLGFAGLTPRGAKDVTVIKAAFTSRLGKDGDQSPFELSSLLSVLHRVEDRDTTALVRKEILPVMQQLVDQDLGRAGVDASDMALIAKVFAMYCSEAAFPYVLKLMAAYPDEYIWTVVFRVFEEDHPFADRLMAELSASLPDGFAGVAFLDFVNARVISGALRAHPFDTEQGHARLRSWLELQDAERASYAHSATAALPFIAEPLRAELLATALSHPAIDVRMEAAWASAKLGKASGLEALRDWCKDVTVSSRAQQYLSELGHPELVPAECQSEAFQARAEMCQWLAHPSEFGAPPSSLEIAATFEVHWPPTGDRRRLFVMRYTYDASSDAAPDEYRIGHGLVGSVTFALFGEATADLKPLHVLALHCCWELEQNGEFKGERTVEAGLKLLARANPPLASQLLN